MSDAGDLSPRTRATRAGLISDQAHRAVVPPIYLSTNFAFRGLGESMPYEYGRTSNPTRDLLGDTVADLEGGTGGAVTSSGMAAITTALYALVPPGGRVVAPHDLYGGTWRLLDILAERGAYSLELVDFSDEAVLGAALAKRPSLVWIETPSNPLMRVTDIAAVAQAAHMAGAVVAADNTFLSPAAQRPIEHGADVVLHSTTKYINGHSDVIAGIAVAADPELAEQLRWWANCLGTAGSPMDSYLVLRGLRTLGVRMRAHEESATALATMLAEHPAVGAVHYPGLADDPWHALAARQQDGFGGMLSFELADADAVARCFDGLRCYAIAESLGGVESLVCHPSTMTHAAMPSEVQQAAGITSGLVRISAGIEDPADLVADLRAGLDRALG